MKAFLLITFALAFLVGACFFGLRGSELLVARDYIAGIVHLAVGLALARGVVELARLTLLTGRGSS